QMQEHEAALDCHVVLDDAGWQRIEAIKTTIKDRLKRHGIIHSSLEFENIHHAHQEAQLFGHGDAGKAGGATDKEDH
ncbi:MAG: cation diffusion facilitator family transporter, partial [Paracoccus sp. (in: a-proteobacteria)]